MIWAMALNEEQIEGARYFDERYDILCTYPLVADQKIKLKDSDDPATRVCRFCGRSKPGVTFGKEAHALPEFLGNKAIISMNECDTCNEYIADHAEDDLSKWLGPMRTASQMRGKNGVPTYKADGIRMEMGPNGIDISITANIDDPGIKEGESVDFTIPVKTPSQPLVPINAAKALVKIACSLAPISELPEIKMAIDWIMGRMYCKFSKFPVLFSFTPGANPYQSGRVLLLRRKVDEKIPYLLCLVATSNVRFQFFVPFCLSDKMEGNQITFSLRHLPVPFGEDWPHGETKIMALDWASEVKAPVNVEVTFHADKVTKQEPPAAAPAAD